MAKAYSTIGTILKAGETVAEIEKLCKIKSYPDLGGSPESVESTDLEDTFQTFVLGVQSMEGMEFTCNYQPDEYEALVVSSDTDLYYQLEMGEYGSQGRFRWQGKHSVRVTGADVNAVREMVLTIVPSTVISVLEEPDPTPSVTLNKNAESVVVNATKSLTATVVPSGTTVTWKSDDTSIATVSGGTVTGKAAGTTLIWASIKVDGTDYYDVCAVTVTAS